MSVAAMTKSELLASLKQHRRELERFTSQLKSCVARVEKQSVMVSEYTARVQLRRGAAQRKAQEQLQRAQDRLDMYVHQQEQVVVQRNIRLLEIQRLEEDQYATMSVSVPSSEEKEEEDDGTSATLMVRLLSGDVKAVEIDMFRPVVTFADEFAQQHGYNPSATSRMVFLIQSEEEEKESTVFWSPEERHEGKTFIEVLSERLGEEFCQDDLPMLNLLIRPMAEDREMGAKVDLIRKLLKEQSLNDDYEDETLFAMFGNWHLTYRPSGAGNRYLTMKAFVEQNGDAFWPMSEEEKEGQKERDEVRDFRKWMKEVAETIHRRSLIIPEFQGRRATAFELMEGMIRQNDVDGMKENRNFCQRYIHPMELHSMGAPADALCGCEHPGCRIGHLGEWLARSGPITLPEVNGIVWRV